MFECFICYFMVLSKSIYIFLLIFSLSVLENEQLNSTCRCGVEGTSKKKSGSNRIINGNEINPVRIQPLFLGLISIHRARSTQHKMKSSSLRAMSKSS